NYQMSNDNSPMIAAYRPTKTNLLILLLLHHPQHVSSKYLLNVLLRIAAAEKLTRQVWQLSDCRQVLRGRLYTVEVRSNSNVIRTNKFYDVIDMIDYARDRHSRQPAGVILSTHA